MVDNDKNDEVDNQEYEITLLTKLKLIIGLEIIYLFYWNQYAVQRRKAVAAYFSSKQLVPFVFAER